MKEENKKRNILIALLLFIFLGIVIFAIANQKNDDNTSRDPGSSDEKSSDRISSEDLGPNASNGKDKVSGDDEPSNIIVIEDAYEKALAAVIKSEADLTMNTYLKAKELVEDLENGAKKTDLLDRLSEVKDAIDVESLVATLERLVSEANSLSNMNNARNFRTVNGIDSKIALITNSAFRNGLQNRLNALKGLLDDMDAPEVEGISDGDSFELEVIVNVTDANPFKIYLSDNGDQEREMPNGVIISGYGKYILRVIDAAYNENVIVFYLDDVPEGSLIAENFNTHNFANTFGISVGFNALLPIDLSLIDYMTVELYAGSILLAINTNNDLSLFGGDRAMSTYFAIEAGSYVETFWTKEQITPYDSKTLPNKAVIKLYETSGIVREVVNTNGLESDIKNAFPSVVSGVFTGHSVPSENSKGFYLDFTLPNLLGTSVKEVTVELYAGSTLLSTNVSNGTQLANHIGGLPAMGTYFATVDGTYIEDCWTTTMASNYSTNNLPTKAIVTIELTNGTIITKDLTPTGDLLEAFPKIIPAVFIPHEVPAFDSLGVYLDFTVANRDDYTIREVKVELYSGSNLLATNISSTTNGKLSALLSEDSEAIGTYFQTIGTYSDPCWETILGLGYKTSLLPNKAVITITLDSGVMITKEMTPTSNLSAFLPIITPAVFIAHEVPSVSQGVYIDFTIANRALIDSYIEEINIALYDGSTLLATNIARGTQLTSLLGGSTTAIGTYFQTFGSYVDPCWTTIPSTPLDTVPSRVVIKIILSDGTIIESEMTPTGDLSEAFIDTLS